MDKEMNKGVFASGRCPECGAWAGLHALSCSHYREADVRAPRLSPAELTQLRSLTPSRWEGWPPEEYDQGLPVVEVRQDHLRALLDEVDEQRGRA
jgi:hypothetical protein